MRTNKLFYIKPEISLCLSVYLFAVMVRVHPLASETLWNGKILMEIGNRPGVAGAVLQTPSWLINSLWKEDLKWDNTFSNNKRTAWPLFWDPLLKGLCRANEINDDDEVTQSSYSLWEKVTCNMSQVTCHISLVTCHMWCVKKKII